MDNNKDCSLGRHRRKWNALPMGLDLGLDVSKEEVVAVKEEVSPQYEQYLLLLQQRNRMMRKLKTKNSQEIAMERKEQGFTLYMNGANAALTPVMGTPQPPSTNRIPNPKAHSRRHLATAQLISRRNKTMIDHQQLKELELDLKREVKDRQAARTAPLDKRRRKRWNLKSLNIKMAGMSDNSVNFSKSYDDDFESDESNNEQTSDDNWLFQEKASPREDNEILAPQPPTNSKPKNNYSRPHFSPRGQKLTMSIGDIKKLKYSLEANALLRQSVAEELNSSEESDIPEEFNEINEYNSNLGSQDSESNLFKPEDHVVLEFGIPPKNSERKLLSIARKKTENSADGLPVMESAEKDAVLAAIQAENSQVGDQSLSNLSVVSHIHQQQQQQTPEQVSSSVRISPRSESLTEQEISSITNNVLQMKPRQQINLIKMLGKLEESASVSLSAHQEKGIICPGTETSICVSLELLTNWGHDKRIGLTEIQLYNKNGKIIPIQPEDISVKNAINESTSIHTLFNGKAKTSKLKNMWSCDLNQDTPVVIVIHCKNTQQTKVLSLAKIKIWNYNHNLKDLNTGVKEIKISVGEELFYNGNIEKGCGNHIFDYATAIDLSTSIPSSLQVNNNNNVSLLLSKRSSTEGDLYKLAHRQPQHLRKASLTQSSSPILSPAHCAGPPKISSQNTSIEFKDSLKDSPRGKKGLNLPLLSPKKLTPRDRDLSFDILKRESSCDSLFSGKPEIVTKESPRMKRTEVEGGNSNRKYLEKMKSDTDILPDILDFQSLSPRTASTRKDIGTTLLDKTLKSPDSPRSITEKVKKTKDSLDWLDDDKSDLLCQISKICEEQPESSRSRSSHRPQPGDDLERIAPSLSDKVWPEPLESLDLPLLHKDKTNPPLDQGMGDSVEIPLQPTLKIRNKSDKADSHSRTRVKRDGSGIPQSPSLARLRTILDDDDDFLDMAVESQPEDDFNLDLNEDDFGRCTPMQKIQKKRSKWRDHSDNKLEEFWGSLNYFNHLHRGRLSMDGDILDGFLNETKANPPQMELALTPPPEVPVCVGQEKHSCISPSDDDFIIPELPHGQELVINIRTTWGDKHYVGLTGIDTFSNKGDPVAVKKISANPKDINILPEYDKDPRVVQNLIDGMNRTRDDVHMWLTPFTSGGNHCITMTFAQPCSIALIRIWNYNKSRIHSFRGARDIDITLDGKLIFRGEIARACGGIEGGTEAFGDTILFSVEEEILEAISRNDEAYEGDALEDISWEENLDIHRPNTATIADSGDGDRPFTRACGVINEVEQQQQQLSTLALMNAVDKEPSLLKGKHLKLNFVQTWGDQHYLGLTSLEVFGGDGQSIPLDLNMVTADPQDLHSLPGHERDDRTLDKLIDGTNVTISDEHMWLVPFTFGKQHLLNIEFPQPTTVSGVRIWNYNKNPEDTYRGAKIVHVEIDGRIISPTDGYLLRKGLGNCHFDFCQEISFMPTDHMSPRHKNLNSARSISTDQPNLCYETVPMPSGFIYQLQLYSTWGDPYYIGLNGLQFFDSTFNQIPLEENNIAAYPDSVNVLNPNQQTDVRTPDKLIDGLNDTKDGSHMWLAPVLPSIVNKVYVIFDQPTTVSMIKIWNYNKTPSRATKDFALLVDELLVCNGSLPPVNTASRGILPTLDMPQAYHTILFSGDQDILRKEKHTIVSNQAPLNQGQDIQMTNNKQVLTTYESPRRGNSKKPVNQAMRPGTCVTGQTIKKRY